MGFYIDVILPVPIDQLFSYEITKTEFSFIKSGCRVAVPFGKSRIITGMVCNIHQVAPISYDVKSIHQIIDESPVVNDNQLQFWAWMSQYYMCSIGDVMKASIPSVLLFESETIVTLNKTIEIDQNILSDDEFLIYEALLDVKELTISEVSNILNKKNVFKFIQSLNEKHILEIDEKLAAPIATCYGQRNCFAWFMVITDDIINFFFVGVTHFIQSFDSTIQCYN